MAQQSLDLRVITVSIEVNGQLKTYSSPLNITASGTKYGNALQNECTVTISNLDRETQDYLTTETSPYNLNRTPKTIIVRAGRESTGTAIIYQGNIISIVVSQPPDIGVTLKCLTGNFFKGQIVNSSFLAPTSVSQISAQVAQLTNTSLNFQATDKMINNYSYGGGALNQVQAVGSMGNYNAYIDDSQFIVKNAFIPLSNTVRILSAETGMIGIPMFTEQGIRVKFLVDNQTKLGGGMQVNSVQYPAANGLYVIYKLAFQIASRDTPFYYIADGARRR